VRHILTDMENALRQRRATRPASVGAALKARRNFLGLKAEEVVERTGGTINLKLLSKIENNHVSPASLKLGKYRMLLAALELTPAEFEELTGVHAALPEPEELPGSVPYIPTLRIPVVGTVSAGLRGHRVIDSETFLALDPSLPGLVGRSEANLVALRVNGDSMVSERVGLSIRSGAHVVVELGAIPVDGDLVAAWLPAREVAVLKKFREEPDTVLRSLNPLGPVFRLADEPIDIRGVVRMVLSYP
jgi:SOS-response transcriptional repressor LexA